MKVKALTNLGTNDYPSCPLLEGEIAEVGTADGERMVACGHAIEIVEQIVAKHVAPAAEVAAVVTPEPTEIKTPEQPPAVVHKPKPSKSASLRS